MSDLTPQQLAIKARIDGFLDEDDSRRPYQVLHGLAGTGKTFLLSEIARERDGAILCTLTGKAASVLHRKTGLAAATIHSVFYRLVGEKRTAKGRRELEWDTVFETGQLDGRILLLDECSMLDDRIARDLLATGVKIIASGDPGQLPPVKGQQFFNVPDLKLTEIHRQAAESPIIRQAHAVRLGIDYQDDTENFRVVRGVSPEELRDADTVICWTNNTRHQLNYLIRTARGHKASHPEAGETVMCLKNNHAHGIYNGATYTLMRDYQPHDFKVIIDVDGEIRTIENACFENIDHVVKTGDSKATPFGYGYAMTGHKSQGSEWDNIIVIDEYSRRDDREKFLYTCFTRAKETCTVVRMV